MARSGFSRWLAAEPGRRARAAAEDALAGQITAVYERSHGTYGSPRVVIGLVLRLLGDWPGDVAESAERFAEVAEQPVP